MRRATAFACAAVVLTAATSALAQPAPGLGQKIPYVFILLDTSGSMEYAEAENIVPACTDAFDPAYPYVKSRWAVALEVFTGSYTRYWCSYDWRVSPADREDYGYPVPHPAPRSADNPAQLANGFLDVNEQYASFGFLAFDSNLGTDPGRPGGYSYGMNVNNALGQLVNLGARNELANKNGAQGSFTRGGLVPVSRKDLQSSVTNTNKEIQQVLLDTVPFGGSPLSPLLSDTRFYMQVDPRMLQYSQTDNPDGDPFYDCRTRNIILFTDGRPTMGEADGEYLTSIDAAADLYSAHPLGVKTYVVGYSLANLQVRDALNAIAVAGDPLNTEAKAYEAQNQAQLVLKLSEILGEITAGVKSRTVPVFTNATRSIDAQYQFNTAYGGVSVNTLDQRGYLEQQIYSCAEECKTEGEGAQVCSTFSISDTLNAQLEPPPTYAILGDRFVDFAQDTTDITPEVLGVSDRGLVNPLEGHDEFLSLEPKYIPPDNPKQTLGTVVLRSDDQSDRERFRNEIIDFVLGAPGSRRAANRFGGVRHGTPALQHALRGESSIIPSFQYYQTAIKDRPTVLFTPTHTGQLMAFRVDREETLKSSEYGEALWSFIPGALLPRLADNGTQLHFLMDTAPTLRDVLLSANKQALDPQLEAERWRSVLVQGYRDGGRGYFALDVTEPETPQLMWEVSTTGRCVEGAGCEPSLVTSAENDFCYLGYSYSKPVIGSVFLEGYNGVSRQDRAVAIFGGGKFDEVDDQIVPDGCGGHPDYKPADVGHSFYVLDLETGEIIKEFRASRLGDPAISTTDKARMLYDIVGSPSCYSNTNGAVITRCFVGDRGGQLWRVDLSSPDPNDWTMSFFHDAYADLGYEHGSVERGPIEEPPTLALQRSTGLVTVIYSTTNIDMTETVDSRHAIYSLSEKLAFDETSGEEAGVLAEVNWKLLFTGADGPLQAGTMVTGQPIVFDEVTYFTTFRFDPEAACGVEDEEAARLWGVHYFRKDPEETLGVETPLGALDQDGDPLTTPTDIVSNVALGKIVPYGVQLIQRPSCIGNVPVDYASSKGLDGASAGGMGKGNLELVIQYEGALQTASPSGPADAVKNAKVQTITRSVRPARTTVTALSWGLVYD